MANLKNITELPVAESADGLNLIVNDNGSAKQIAASAVGAQADWNVEDATSPAYIMNKPEMGFIFRPAADTLTVDGTTCTCTANYDELAKALEAGKHVTIVLPAALLGVACAVNVVSWGYADGVLCCVGILFGEIGVFNMTNGTYVPTLE